MGKTVTASKFSEWKGLDRIGPIVHSMPSIFREISKDDFGIDGEIEIIVSKASGEGFETTGGIIKVQSKSGASYIKQDSEQSFSTPVERNDLEAFETRKQGAIARAQFLQARYDYARPVLIIVSSPQSIPVQQGNEVYLDWYHQPPVLEVRNVGNGPALNVRSVIYGPEALAVVDPSTMPSSVVWKHLSDTKENHWYHWTTYAVSRGDPGQLQYTLLRPNIFSEANKYIESKNHTQKYAFNAPKQPLSPANSKEPRSICRVTITYHDVFHRKHASIYDLIFRQKWQVVALIDDIRNDLDDLVE